MEVSEAEQAARRYSITTRYKNIPQPHTIAHYQQQQVIQENRKIIGILSITIGCLILVYGLIFPCSTTQQMDEEISDYSKQSFTNTFQQQEPSANNKLSNWTNNHFIVSWTNNHFIVSSFDQEGLEEDWQNRTIIHHNILIKEQKTCTLSVQEQAEKMINNHQVFTQIKQSSGNFVDQLQKVSTMFTKVTNLMAKKHPKFTSPYALNAQDASIWDWVNPFAIKKRQYPSQILDQLFKSSQILGDYEQACKQNQWNSQGNYFTFNSFSPIKMSVLSLNVPKKLEKTEIFVFGITAFMLSHSFQSNLIMKGWVKGGNNLLFCQQLKCQRYYSMLMIVMKPMKICGIQVFSSQQTYEDYHKRKGYLCK